MLGKTGLGSWNTDKRDDEAVTIVFRVFFCVLFVLFYFVLVGLGRNFKNRN